MKGTIDVSLTVAVSTLIAVSLPASAALVAPNLTTFSGGGGGTANTAIYTLESTANSIFTLENSVTDGDFLDAADDGYALLERTGVDSATNSIVGSYGSIEGSDVGKVVIIDAAARHDNGTTASWTIQIDGVDVGVLGDQSFLSVNTFGSGNFDSDTNYLLSTVPTERKDGTSPATNPNTNLSRTAGALTYTIGAGDVGKNLGMRLSSFDSTGSRRIFIDSISFDVVPEPSGAALIAFGALGFLRRRRR